MMTDGRVHRRERRGGPRRAATKEAPEEELGRLRETSREFLDACPKTWTDE
jgi:hypothetical protein